MRQSLVRKAIDRVTPPGFSRMNESRSCSLRIRCFAESLIVLALRKLDDPRMDYFFGATRVDERSRANLGSIETLNCS